MNPATSVSKEKDETKYQRTDEPAADVSGPKRNHVFGGDVRNILPTLPENSVDCVITSPPYFRLRNYQQADQIGLEASIDQWVTELRDIFNLLSRVLKPTGSVWLNLGDSYSKTKKSGAPAKGMLLGPERLLLALATDGWLVRNKVIWAKRNPMPSSVKDRLNTTFEYVYFLTRSPNYFFDLDAIRIPHTTAKKDKPSNRKHRSSPRPSFSIGGYPPVNKLPKNGSSLAGNNVGLRRMKQRGLSGHPAGKNPGDVWRLSTASYHGAHFATFPGELVRTPLLATCPERVCSTCSLGWERITQEGSEETLRPNCDCKDANWQPGLVLDPFFGSGTVGVVAQQLGRDWLGIELNPDYIKLADKRLADSKSTNTSSASA